MTIVSVMFIDGANKKPIPNREYVCEPGTPPIQINQGDIVAFESKGDDVEKWTVQTRELQEVAPGDFVLLYTIIRVPLLKK